ncbi:MAG: hypothetical protein AB7F75_08555 [Planctomycetota bacterium]
MNLPGDTQGGNPNETPVTPEAAPAPAPIAEAAAPMDYATQTPWTPPEKILDPNEIMNQFPNPNAPVRKPREAKPEGQAEGGHGRGREDGRGQGKGGHGGKGGKGRGKGKFEEAPPKPQGPRPGDPVEILLLETKTKSGGWMGTIGEGGRKGFVFDSGKAPGEWKAGEKVKVFIRVHPVVPGELVQFQIEALPPKKEKGGAKGEAPVKAFSIFDKKEGGGRRGR